MKNKPPIIIAEDKPKDSDPFSFEALLESSNHFNSFQTKTKTALANNSRHDFLEAYDIYEAYIITSSTGEDSEKEIKLNMIKAICSVMMDFIHSKEFDEQESLNYLKVLEGKIAPRLIALQLWGQDKKEATFAIFKTHNIFLEETTYDTLAEMLRIYEYNQNVPIAGIEKQEYLDKQKQEFLYYQKNYSLLEELKKMPVNDTAAKKIKL